MSKYTVTIDPLDLTPRHIGQQALYSCHTRNGLIAHEDRVNNISFDTEHIILENGEIGRDIITAEVLLGDVWYPLRHVRFVDTTEPWGKGGQ